MGTDIHVCVEIKVDYDEWQFKNWGGQKFQDWAMLEERFYPVFAALADMRNYGPFTPISQPKGLPADCSIATLARCHDVAEAHSHSWLTLAELEGYDWDPICAADWVDPPRFVVEGRSSERSATRTVSASSSGSTTDGHAQEDETGQAELQDT
jgi:hypothetical protein